MKSIVLAIVLLNSISVFGQKSSYKENYHLDKYKNRCALMTSISYQSQLFSDINIMIYNIDTAGYLPVTKGARLGFETNFSSQHFVYGPKIGYEMAGMMIYRITAINYFDNKNVDLRILPEIGISICGAISLTYGYNIPITPFKSTSISNNKVSLSFLLDFKYWKALGML